MPEIENGSRYNMPNISKFQKGDDPDQWLQMYQDAAQVGSLETNEVELYRFDDLRRRHQKEAVLYEDVSIIEDRELCEIFIKAQPNKVMRNFVCNTGPTTLKQAKVAVKDYLYADSSDNENSDSESYLSSSSESSDNNTSDYSSESSESETRRSRKRREYQKKKTHVKNYIKNQKKEEKVTQEVPDPIDLLTKQINNLPLMVNEKHAQTAKTAENNQARGSHILSIKSGNCIKRKTSGGHLASGCKAPYKICKGTITPYHTYFNYPDNKRNKESANSTSYLVSITNDKDQDDDNQKLHDADDESEGLLVESNLAAFKRNREDVSQGERTKEKPKKLKTFVKEPFAINTSIGSQGL
ncbi:hypothetical protein INT45_012546 [Circinella minor]|uniref:Uncharacterized protein n=1 Tax=Circinella minor TaxID=1195481 RepID=A0A8H7RHN8_9FUNG|nr:hypothetical protein INT45_012546 [Circinella minor]